MAIGARERLIVMKSMCRSVAKNTGKTERRRVPSKTMTMTTTITAMTVSAAERNPAAQAKLCDFIGEYPLGIASGKRSCGCQWR